VKRTKKRAPKIIDVTPVEVSEVRTPAVRRPVRQAIPGEVPTPRIQPQAEVYYPAGSIDPTGRLDIAAYRLASEYFLPAAENLLRIPGLAQVLAPWAEYFIAETLPGPPPKPRRRLR
jgi:hypothetical protein